MEIMLFQIWFFFMLLIMWYIVFRPFSFSNKVKKNISVEKGSPIESDMKMSENELVDKKINYSDVVNLMNQIVEMDKDFLTKIKMDTNLKETQHDLYNLLKLRMQTIEDLTKKYNVIFDYAQDESQCYANLILLKHPELSEREVRLCHYFKMNLSAKEVANLEGLTDGSVRVYKTKLKAKMGVHPSESLTSYLRTFDRVA